MQEALLGWLDAGCPGYHFRMDWGWANITKPGTAAPLSCGTVCCIAGYAAAQTGIEPPDDVSADWDCIIEIAFDAYALPKISPDFGHPLFSLEDAPLNCTRAQAAVAARAAFADPYNTDPWAACRNHKDGRPATPKGYLH